MARRVELARVWRFRTGGEDGGNSDVGDRRDSVISSNTELSKPKEDQVSFRGGLEDCMEEGVCGRMGWEVARRGDPQVRL